MGWKKNTCTLKGKWGRRCLSQCLCRIECKTASGSSTQTAQFHCHRLCRIESTLPSSKTLAPRSDLYPFAFFFFPFSSLNYCSVTRADEIENWKMKHFPLLNYFFTTFFRFISITSSILSCTSLSFLIFFHVKFDEKILTRNNITLDDLSSEKPNVVTRHLKSKVPNKKH